MADYIKREDANDALRQALTIDSAKTRINNLPSADVVEVVRCKDCMHYDEDLEECCHPKSVFLSGIEAGGFCHYGERKDD